MIYVRETRQDDLEHLADNLRDADLDELHAQCDLEPLTTLKLAMVLAKRCMTVSDLKGTPLGIFGVNSTSIKGLGAIWMMATPDLLKHREQFMRECKDTIREVSQGYSCVFNYTDERNTVHHRWLKWCGFTFIKRHSDFGLDKQPFLEFVKIL